MVCRVEVIVAHLLLWVSLTACGMADECETACRYGDPRACTVLQTDTSTHACQAANGAASGTPFPSGSNGTGRGPNCVEFDPLREYVMPPSNIAVFFSVSTCDGDPVTTLREDDFELREDGDRLDGLSEAKQRVFAHTAGTQLFSLFLLDMSNSILNAPDGLGVLRAAAIRAAEILADHVISIAVFDGSRDLRTVVDFKTSAEAQRALDRLDADVSRDPDSTNLHGAVVEGLDRLNGFADAFSPYTVFSGNLLLFTDGTDEAGSVQRLEAVQAAAQSEHNIWTVGLGQDIDGRFLADIATHRSVHVDDFDALEPAFAEVAVAIRAESRKYYALGYCSPKRDGSGTHTLDITIKGRSGHLRLVFDATNFVGGCDAEALARQIAP